VPNRLVGYFVDALLLTILSFLGAVAISIAFGPVVTINVGGASQVTIDPGLAFANAILGTFVSLIYFVGSWRTFGGSPGQRLLGMRVSGVDGGVTLVRWVIRWTFIGIPVAIVGVLSAVAAGWMVLIAMILVACWFVLLLASIARSSTKQGWLDRAARTMVTKRLVTAEISEPPGGGIESRVQ
jgi:hypothetical protein